MHGSASRSAGGAAGIDRRFQRAAGAMVLLGPVSWFAAEAAVRAAYSGRLGGPFARIITGQDLHPLEHYLAVIAAPRLALLVGLLLTGAALYALSFEGWRRRATALATGGRAGASRMWRPTVALTLLVAAAIRLVDLGGTSLWVDEAMVSMVSVRGLEGMFGRMVHDSSAAPGHHLVQLAFLTVGSQTATIARLPSALAGILTVGLLLRMPRWGLPRGVALVAAVMLALSPAHVGFSRDATQYSAAVTIAVILVACGLAVSATARTAARPRTVLLVIVCAATPWVAYPSVLVALAMLAALLLVTLGSDRASRHAVQRAVFAASSALLVSGAIVHRLVAQRQMQVLDNWYLAANYPGSSGLPPLRWGLRMLEGFFAVVAGGQVRGRGSASGLDGLRALLAEGGALGWVLLAALVLGGLSLLPRASAAPAWSSAEDVATRSILTMAALLLAGSFVAAALGLYPFGGIHQQLHATPVILLGSLAAGARLLVMAPIPLRVAVGAIAGGLFLLSAAGALPAVFEEREDIVAAVVIGVDGRQGRGLEPLVDRRVWIYRAARPAVRFHFPERAFTESRVSPTDLDGMVAEITSLAEGGDVALVFSHIYPHPEEQDQRRALQRRLVEAGWLVRREIHHTNTVMLDVRAP